MPARPERFSLSYRLIFHAPFHCGTGLRGGLVHRLVQRGPDGYVLVPGSTVKGLVRNACEHVIPLIATAIESDFGASLPSLRVHSPHDQAAALGDLHPTGTLLSRIFGTRAHAGTVYFDDAALSEQWRDFFSGSTGSRADALVWQVEQRTQVTMSRSTGTAQRGMLRSSEYGLRGTEFVGRIYGSLDDWSPPDDDGTSRDGTFALLLLLAGLGTVERLGAQRSSGLGDCTFTVTGLRVNGTAREPAVLLQRFADFPYHYLLSTGEA